MSFQELTDSLETLLRQHEQMIEYGQKKKEALIVNDIDSLNETVNKEARLLKLIVEADGRRMKAANELLRERGFAPTPSLKVAQLVRMVTNPADKLALSDLADRLSATVEKLRVLNDLNMNLAKHSIEFNDYSLSLLTGGYDDQDYVYKKPSDSSYGKPNLKIFDSRA